ncbi:MAG: EAL domain-containing protein [Nitrospirae bacterium]|nr:EAL domain-containing protein [Nitrospirota bacterium]
MPVAGGGEERQQIMAAIRRSEHRSWQLWLIATLVILALTLTVIGLNTPQLTDEIELAGQAKTYLLSLSALILLFCGYILRTNSTLGKLRLEVVLKEVEKAEVQSLLRKIQEKSNELLKVNDRLEREIAQRNLAEEQLSYVAHHDPVTGLPNRQLMLDRIRQSLARLPWWKRQMAVMYLDLDHFKRVNETLGHSSGDLLLRAVAERLTTCVRQGDTVCRLGGDEFVIVLSDMAKAEDLPIVAQKVLDSVAKPFVVSDHELFIGLSIGISLFPNDGEDAETLLKHADAAMYRAKDQGRNNYQLYSPELNVMVRERLLMETNLRHAVNRQEFTLHYQPLFDVHTGRIISTEALVRWQHPEAGMIPPIKFISLAEELGLIVPLGEWVLRTACLQNKAWEAAGLPPIPVAVNVSARQLKDASFPKMLARILSETGLSPDRLELELTENIMQDYDRAATLLAELHIMGVGISIDDFGTGYSSLSYLKRLPIHKLKIDRSFVSQIATEKDDSAIVAAIITMAHSLDLKVVAEGVETQAQLDYLAALQCDEAQGYLFSRPLAEKDVTKFMAERFAQQT